MSIKTLIALSLALLAGCTARGPYRTHYPGTPIPAGIKEDKRVIEEHDGFQLGFVEFADDGKQLEKQRQADLVIETIQKARKLKPNGAVSDETIGGLTVLYAHGWKNNARSREGIVKDVEKFRGFLSQLAAEIKPAAGKSPIPITGVYLGWHGKSVDIDSGLLNWWTLWPRYFAAGHVGGPVMQRTVARAIQAGIAGRRTLPEDKRPRVILIGHSLGARVLENALEQADDTGLEDAGPGNDRKLGLILGQCKNLQDGKNVKSIVDLTLLVNEATRSRRVRAATKACFDQSVPNVMVRHPASTAENCPPNSTGLRCQPYPIYVHVTTSADLATRLLAPVALLGRTAPHTPRLWTHRVTLAGQPSSPAPLFTFQTAEDAPRTYAVARVDPKIERNPVWVMRVDGHVMKNHGDIWNESFQNMMKGLMGSLDVVEMRGFSRETREYIKR